MLYELIIFLLIGIDQVSKVWALNYLKDVGSISILYYLHKNNNISIIGKSGIILIISGAIGNLIDRVRLGFVVDYFDFRFIWEYVFNVADVFVVIGTILLCIYILTIDDEK